MKDSKNAQRNKPEYYVSSFAKSWSEEKINELRKEGKELGISEEENLYDECVDVIYRAIESGELEAVYPDKHVFETFEYPDIGRLVTKQNKTPCLWIIKTDKYIEWAKANGAGPSSLWNETGIDKGVQEKSPISEKPLDPREKNSLLSIIAALCEELGTTPDEPGLANRLSKITERLGMRVSERAIKEHLKKAHNISL